MADSRAMPRRANATPWPSSMLGVLCCRRGTGTSRVPAGARTVHATLVGDGTGHDSKVRFAYDIGVRSQSPSPNALPQAPAIIDHPLVTPAGHGVGAKHHGSVVSQDKLLEQHRETH